MVDYDLETKRVIEYINECGAKKVCLQLPDGLKPLAKSIVDAIYAATNNTVTVFIWAGSNFGSCDIPLELSRLGVDVLIHYGHSEWVYDKEMVQ
jgi:2-(3-amino-3-carboxypropyl)histidine synthase